MLTTHPRPQDLPIGPMDSTQDLRFTSVRTPDPHILRRRELLKKYPQLRSLYGCERGTAALMFLLTVVQLGIAWLFQNYDVH